MRTVYTIAMGLNSVADYERRAREIISTDAWEYYDYGRDRRWCYEDSISAFSRYRVRSQVLQDVSNRSLATTLLGQPLKYPICVAPTALQAYAHPDGEKATAIGAEKAETLMVLSSGSGFSMADVSTAAPNGHRWMQMYPYIDRRLALNVIRRAERLGFKALVITVDSPFRGLDSRITDIINEHHISKTPNTRMAVFKTNIPPSQAATLQTDRNLAKYIRETQYNSAATWNYIKWLKDNTFLPIVCKGIMTGESACAAADAGVDGILVSAHGGRQMDGAPAPIDALSEVVDAVRGRDIEVYMDGGIRTGSDVFKALGRGARAVFVGRPILWGLACEGAEGVKNVLGILRSQLDGVLAVSGCTSPNSIPEGTVVHQSYYHRGPREKSINSKL